MCLCRHLLTGLSACWSTCTEVCWWHFWNLLVHHCLWHMLLFIVHALCFTLGQINMYSLRLLKIQAGMSDCVLQNQLLYGHCTKYVGLIFGFVYTALVNDFWLLIKPLVKKLPNNLIFSWNNELAQIRSNKEKKRNALVFWWIRQKNKDHSI